MLTRPPPIYQQLVYGNYFITVTGASIKGVPIKRNYETTI